MRSEGVPVAVSVDPRQLVEPPQDVAEVVGLGVERLNISEKVEAVVRECLQSTAMTLIVKLCSVVESREHQPALIRRRILTAVTHGHEVDRAVERCSQLVQLSAPVEK
ncbi:MAG TPA: hypothetical protein PK331_16125 [Gordonia sp. (in: high G+C Gram-positive bacteria)]|nr:hypothetical protein [Gordonia sp. (in: high G+C Gram-positive bacteria)]